MRLRIAALIALAAAAALALGSGGADGATWKRPAVGWTWQLQLQGALDTSVAARIYDVDGADTGKAAVQRLRRAGRYPVCYLSAGSWENWRADRRRFPARVLGEPLEDWPGERYVDVRALDALLPIMRDRIAACRVKGFLAVDADNVDSYESDATGFPLTRADGLRYVRALAKEAHRQGLAYGLKNAPGLVRDLKGTVDFAVVEECFEQRGCGAFQPLIAAGRPVLAVEYALPASRFCPEARTRRFSAILRDLDLGRPPPYVRC